MVDIETTTWRLNRSSVSDPPQWQRPGEMPKAASHSITSQLHRDLKTAFDAVGGGFLRGVLTCYAVAAVPLGIAGGFAQGNWLRGLIVGVLGGMLVSVLIQKHEERTGRRVARQTLASLTRRRCHDDPQTLAWLERLLKDRREPPRHHLVRRDAIWQELATVIGGYLELHEAAGLDLDAARQRVLESAKQRSTNPLAAQTATASPMRTPRPVPWAAPTPFVPVGLACAQAHVRHSHAPELLALIGVAIKWIVACTLGGGVFWACCRFLPLGGEAKRYAVAAGLGVVTWRVVLAILHGPAGAKASAHCSR